MAEKTYYDVLEVPQNASKEVIKKAYRGLQKKWHIDKWIGSKARAIQRGDDAEEIERFQMMIEQCEEKLKEINEAYETLSDDDKRRNYDLSLKTPRPQASPSQARPKPRSNPPVITITPPSLNFGKLPQDTGRYSLSFVIDNAGGPVAGDIELAFTDNTYWADMEWQVSDPGIFPITVKVTVNGEDAPYTQSKGTLVFTAGTEVFEIPVLVEVERPVQKSPPPPAANCVTQHSL